MWEIMEVTAVRLAGILPESVVDGPGLRFVVFAQGCPHHCRGCHNPETWDPAGGKEMTVKEITKLLKKRLKYGIKGITLSGGEPFLQAEEMALLAGEARKMGLDVTAYTGFLYEELLEMTEPGIQELLNSIDLLIDGPFIEERKDLALAFRGSDNQRIIDLSATRVQGRIVLIA